jgi:GrpB-like predicted nucleotidyltransferase (UPF0157 family)
MSTHDDDVLGLGLGRGMVRLVAADPRWPALFSAEVERLGAAVQRSGLPPLIFEHVGSTSISGLVAKPIIDLMAGQSNERCTRRYVELAASLGYTPRGPQGVPGRELLVRGPETARTHHLNLVLAGGIFWREHVLFRDRLRAEPELAAAYAALKSDLAARYVNDREAYTAGKAGFVASVLKGLHAPPAR